MHVSDLADLYEVVLSLLLSPPPSSMTTAAPRGKEGIYFTENGLHNWEALSRTVAAAGHQLGTLNTADVDSVQSTEWMTLIGGPIDGPSIQSDR